jgi:DNA-binding NtrC family response regulator
LAAPRVCVIDDEQDICDYLFENLSETFEVETFTSAEAALDRIVSAGGFDVVITDYTMPKMRGSEVLARVKELFPTTSVIIATGNADKKAATESLNNGAFALIEKPFGAMDLFIITHRAALHAQLLDRNERMVALFGEVYDRIDDSVALCNYLAEQRHIVDDLMQDVRDIRKMRLIFEKGVDANRR